MFILGISSFYHDSAAVLIKDGVVIAAAEEERFTRVKHDNSFPYQAIKFCLNNSRIGIEDIDYIAYYEKPLLKFERILSNFITTYPRSLRSFVQSMPEWLGEKIQVKNVIKKKLKYSGKIYFVPHHLSHASAAYYTSLYTSSAILTIDGVGEYQTTALWSANESKITLLKEMEYPNSLGLLYSTFTAFCGFQVNEGEYKLMGLAAYGKQKYIQDIYKLVDVRPDGSFRTDMKYFSYGYGEKMFSHKFEELFGSPRKPEGRITERHKDIAASIQAVTEEIYFKMVNHLASLTSSKSLCIGGGVALNSLANGKLYENTVFKDIYIFGPAGDSGGAMGAALFVSHSILGVPRIKKAVNLGLGKTYDDSDIEAVLEKNELSYQKFSDKQKLVDKTVDILLKNQVVGWFQGGMEFGPRALGSRSILASPLKLTMKESLNKIKNRESFRPFGAMVLEEKIHTVFKVPKEKQNFQYMNFCFQVLPGQAKKIPAVVHGDNTCRVQAVNASNGLIYDLLQAFYKKSANPCIVNTSFNLKGDPIVESPEQAVRDFLLSGMDHMVIGSFLVTKN